MQLGFISKINSDMFRTRVEHMRCIEMRKVHGKSKRTSLLASIHLHARSAYVFLSAHTQSHIRRGRYPRPKLLGPLTGPAAAVGLGEVGSISALRIVLVCAWAYAYARNISLLRLCSRPWSSCLYLCPCSPSDTMYPFSHGKYDSSDLPRLEGSSINVG